MAVAPLGATDQTLPVLFLNPCEITWVCRLPSLSTQSSFLTKPVGELGARFESVDSTDFSLCAIVCSDSGERAKSEAGGNLYGAAMRSFRSDRMRGRVFYNRRRGLEAGRQNPSDEAAPRLQ
jgi:hypothetical protein